ncbi:hypothetical protein G9A89_007223 [Geosiphon pyriformis]|nr:hypothetical protein G9A89_007223 [Geosiphon pyriformis]
MVKKTKSSEKWRQSLASAIVTLNPFVVSNKILDEISIVSSNTSSKMGQDQSLTVLPNVVSFSRLLPVLEAKQFSPVRLPVFENWIDQIETESSPSLVFGVTFVHGFLGIKSVLKDNVKLFCVEFASQVSLEAAFLVELTSSVHLATLKIAKSLVVSESGSFSAAVVLRDVPLGVSAADIKTALSVFGSVTCVVLKPAGIWQYVVVYFKKFKAKLVNLSLGCTAFEISNIILQHCFQCQETDHLAVDCKVVSPSFSKASKIFKPNFVGSLSYAKTSAPPVMSEFPLLVAFASPVAVVNPVVGSRLNSLEKQISDLAALVKFIVESVGFLVVLVSRLLDDNAIKAVQVEKDLFSMKYASNNFANLMVSMSKDFACLRSEVDFGGMDYDNM